MRVTALVEPWLQAYPIIQRRPVTAACSLLCVVGMPTLVVADLALLTRWWLWIFGLDDRFDDFAVPQPELAEWSGQFAARLCSDPPGAGAESDLLLAAFATIGHDLRRYPLFAALQDAWDRAMLGVVQGMLMERHWSHAAAAGELPSYAAYLANGIQTISVRPYTLAVCTVASDPAPLGALPHLDPLIATAARCFRLANDLRSDERERQEGKLNAVSLLQQQFMTRGVSETQALDRARTQLRDTCVGDVAHLKLVQTTAPAPIRALARFLWATSAFIYDLYAVSDFDTLSELLATGVISECLAEQSHHIAS